jgi:methionyl-tRNA formyltransferase
MDYLRGNLVGQAQDESLVSYAKKIEKAEGAILWTQSADEICNRYRGLTLGPGVWSTLRGGKIKLFQLTAMNEHDIRDHAPGEILSIEKDAIIVATGHGAVRVGALQSESRKRQTVGDFLKGHKLQAGECFGK